MSGVSTGHGAVRARARRHRLSAVCHSAAPIAQRMTRSPFCSTILTSASRTATPPGS